MEKIKKRCSLTDLAKMANVNISTVSRVLNNQNTRIKVSKDKQEEIRALALKFDYVPNVNARRLSSSKTNTIGLVVPTEQFKSIENILLHSSFLEFLEGVQAEIGNNDYFLLLIPQTKRYFEEKLYLKLLKQKQIDVLIVWGATLKDEYFYELQSEKCILVNTFPREPEMKYCIGNDNRKLFSELMEVYIQKGYKNLIYIGENGAFNSIGMECYQGFCDTLKRHNLDYSRCYPCHFDREQAIEIFREILSSGKVDFDLVAAANNDLACGIFEVATEFGYTPGKDFMVTGAAAMGINFPDGSKIPSYVLDNFLLGQKTVKTAIDMNEKNLMIPFNIKLDGKLIL